MLLLVSRGNRRRIFDYLSFLSELDIAYLHVFTYSERPNTEAVDFEGEVPKSIRNKRSKMLRGLSAKKRHTFYQSQLGTTIKYYGRRNKKGYIHGFTLTM